MFENMSPVDSQGLAQELMGSSVFILKYFLVGELPKLVNNRAPNDYV